MECDIDVLWAKLSSWNEIFYAPHAYALTMLHKNFAQETEAATKHCRTSAARSGREIEGADGFNNDVNGLDAEARLRWDSISPRIVIGGKKAARIS